MERVHSLIDVNILFLVQGKSLIETISDQQYIFNDSPFFSSSAGKHLRHVLDYYANFLNGCYTQIDYDARARDERVERERHYAVLQVTKYITKLRGMASDSFLINQSALVKSNEAEAESDNPWSISSVKRELYFLIGHTVHHYALMNFILRVQGVIPPEDFGVAPSTLKHELQMVQES